VAARLFSERGFHGTSTRDIARACNIQPASLYSHVDSKDELLVEIVANYFAVARARTREAFEGPGTGADRLKALVKTLVEVGVEHRDELLAMTDAWSYIMESPKFAKSVKIRWALQDATIALIREGIRDGSLRDDLNPVAVCWILDSTNYGMVDPRYQRAGLDPGSAPVDTLLSVILEGLEPRPRSGTRQSPMKRGTRTPGRLRGTS
jgi:AcrR family transcriptional regulator